MIVVGYLFGACVVHLWNVRVCVDRVALYYLGVDAVDSLEPKIVENTSDFEMFDAFFLHFEQIFLLFEKKFEYFEQFFNNILCLFFFVCWIYCPL